MNIVFFYIYMSHYENFLSDAFLQASYDTCTTLDI